MRTEKGVCLNATQSIRNYELLSVGLLDGTRLAVVERSEGRVEQLDMELRRVAVDPKYEIIEEIGERDTLG